MSDKNKSFPRKFIPGVKATVQSSMGIITPTNADPGLGPIAGYTVNFDFNLVNFDWVTWHDYEWFNWTQVDALLQTAIGFLNIQGIWQPNNDYVVNQSVYDPDDTQTLYKALSTHTSGTVWATDRDTYWTLVNDTNSPVLSVHARAGDVVAEQGDYASFFYTKAEQDVTDNAQDQFAIDNANDIVANSQAIASNDIDIADRYTKAEVDAIVDGVTTALRIQIGDLYHTTRSGNPSSLLGYGTWEAYALDQTMIGAGGAYTLGDTGGAATHVLTEAQIPSHNHTIAGFSVTSGGHSVDHTHGSVNFTSSAGTGGSSLDVQTTGGASHRFGASSGGVSANHTHSTNIPTKTTTSKGSGSAHNNMQPYIAVNYWKRLT